MLIHLCAIHVVFASFESVGVGGLRDDSIADPPVPRSGGVAAAAAGAAVITARHEVLGAGKEVSCAEGEARKDERQKRENKGGGA